MEKEAAYILSFAPHPLDMEMGMGGIVAHYINEVKMLFAWYG